MRLAAIDIGTNSIHMIVVQVRPDLSFEIVDREKEMVRLGRRRPRRKRAGPGSAWRRRSRRWSASSSWPSRGRSTRSSRRRRAPFAKRATAASSSPTVAERTGIRPRVISGIEEARLIHLAAVYGVDASSGTTVVIDVGGGSTEVTLGTATEVHLARSYHARRAAPDRPVRPERPARPQRRAEAGEAHPGQVGRVRPPDHRRRLRLASSPPRARA